MNPKSKWMLIKYDKQQLTSSDINGEIVFEQDTLDGFVEELFKDDADKFVWQIQYNKEGALTLAGQIGQFTSDKEQNEKNKRIAEAIEWYKLIQVTIKELALIKQALGIAENNCIKAYNDLFISLIKVIGNHNLNSQNDHARYWLDLAKDFADLNKSLTIIINNP